MSKVLVTESSLSGIAAAIRAKNGSSDAYKPGQMAAAIQEIPTGITPTGTVNITQNGTVDVTDYASADVAVPNSYAAADEGKVVSNGALVAQTARTSEIMVNGTYDTTNNNSVTVNVSGGGGTALFYCAGEYLGDMLGGNTTTLGATLSADVGTVAVIVVMHRSALTIPNGWTLVDHRDNPMTSATGNVPQQISILKRTMAAAQESVTITQSSNVRMCGSVFYFSADPNIAYDSTQAMDSGLSIFSYTISKKAKPTFIVISNTSTSDTAISTMVPEGIYAKPDSDIRYFNTNGRSTKSGFRLLAIINNTPKDIVLTQTIPYDEDNSSINRAFIYTLG